MAQLKNGKITHKRISSHGNKTIKFNANGVYCFFVWRGSKCFEDRLWSIESCENAIDEMNSKKGK